MSCEQRAAEKASWEKFHCLKEMLIKTQFVKSCSGFGLCAILGMSIGLLNPNTEDDDRVKWKETWSPMMLMG